MALLGGAVRADTTPPSANWCGYFYNAERVRAGAAAVSWNLGAAIHVLNPVQELKGFRLTLKVPLGYQSQAGDDVAFIAQTKVEHPMHELASGWAPIMVVYTAHADSPGSTSFESILPTMKASGDLYPATVTHIIRNTTVGDFPARELCAVVARSPGHATLKKGGHRPLPLSYDLVHGFELLRSSESVGIIYRIEQQSVVEDEARFGVVTARKQ